MASSREYQDWHNKTWKIIDIHNHADVDDDDIITFEQKAGGTRIKSVTCSHTPSHGSEWNGVDCTGDSSNKKKADGNTKTSGTQFTIESSFKNGKHLLTCDIVSKLPIPKFDSDDPGTTGSGACWIAEEQP